MRFANSDATKDVTPCAVVMRCPESPRMGLWNVAARPRFGDTGAL